MSFYYDVIHFSEAHKTHAGCTSCRLHYLVRQIAQKFNTTVAAHYILIDSTGSRAAFHDAICSHAKGATSMLISVRRSTCPQVWASDTH